MGIPVTLSTDPRHAFSSNPDTEGLAGAFSQWPQSLGFAALGEEELMQPYADVARQEYLAAGFRVALDLATEPRWSRIGMTFGEDADLTARLVVAYLRGFQGAELGPASVACMTKHFPGGGSQQDARGPALPGRAGAGLPRRPLRLPPGPVPSGHRSGTSQMMPYYGMPIGTPYEEVGFGFNAGILTGLLREQLGFAGIVCTDWGLLTDSQVIGQPLPARAWGVEHLSPLERVEKALTAGVNQFGGRESARAGAGAAPRRPDLGGADRRLGPAAAAREVRPGAVRPPVPRRRPTPVRPHCRCSPGSTSTSKG